ncbi:DUF3486 family protein [Klebsiella michiganensis]|uniref:DUF3486 family protein n=1 Tax=Klebsiella michiganensis TaxID=1134687 RepID=UPI001F14A754|nr:DUF3486 family protein [Klebsiella michiganensis]EKP1133456.1 DUF3486 family protein [Klebsiella michiganensis]
MASRSTVEKLPEEVRRWLERSLNESGFSGYAELESLLRDKGYVISKSAIHRYGQKIEKRFGAIRAATEAARMLTEGAEDDQDARSEAVIALIQTELFESIVQLQEAGEEENDPKKRVELLSKVAKNIATLSRASVNLKKFQADARERIKREARAELIREQEENLKETATAQGLSEDQVQFWRERVLGIK